MRMLAGMALIAAVIATASAAAEPPKAKEPEQIIREGAERILEGVRGLIDRIPQYGVPEMLPNGDIIIRKLPRSRNDSWPESLKPAPDGSLRT